MFNSFLANAYMKKQKNKNKLQNVNLFECKYEMAYMIEEAFTNWVKPNKCE